MDARQLKHTRLNGCSQTTNPIPTSFSDSSISHKYSILAHVCLENIESSPTKGQLLLKYQATDDGIPQLLCHLPTRVAIFKSTHTKPMVILPSPTNIVVRGYENLLDANCTMLHCIMECNLRSAQMQAVIAMKERQISLALAAISTLSMVLGRNW